LVLRGYRMSESSRIVVLYTRDLGKIRLAARGARRPKSKFGASLEAITWGSYVFYTRENRDLQTLSEGDIISPFEGIKKDYRRMVFASAVCDLLDHLTPDEDRNALLCSITLDSLRWMESISEMAIELPLWYFQLKAASSLGYRPHLSGCVQCGQCLAGNEVQFSPKLGGTLCGSCGYGGMVVKRSTVSYLESLQIGTPDRIDVEAFLRTDRQEGERILRHFLDYHIENRKKVKALDFLDRMLAAEGVTEPYRSSEPGVGT
jgi:DNA repair protein RecO (recombination protein O)